MERFGLVGINHRRGSAEEIAGFSRKPEDLEELRRSLGVDELIHLSTCNRVELLYADQGRVPADQVLRAFAAWLTPDPEQRKLACSAFYALNGDAAVKHLFNTVCGLDSLVFGDEQIVGQFRQALVAARQSGSCGPWLGMLGDEALKVSRKIRPGLQLSHRPTSVAEVAVQVLRERAREGDALRVVLVGSGEMIRTTAQRLKGWKNVRLHFVNRTVSHASALADLHGGTAQPLEAFQAEATDFDAMVAATAAPEAVIRAEHLAHLPEPEQPRLLLDLGMPADIEPALAGSPRYRRLDVLELGRRASAGRRESEMAARLVRPQLRDALLRLRDKLIDRDLSPAADHMRRKVEERAHQELERWLEGRLSHLSAEDRAVVTQLVQRLAQQTVQIPIQTMRQLVRELPLEGPIHPLIRGGGLPAAAARQSA